MALLQFSVPHRHSALQPPLGQPCVGPTRLHISLASDSEGEGNGLEVGQKEKDE